MEVCRRKSRMPDDRTIRAEICVLGGGPAGAAAALRLATLGHSVCLVESLRFPRRHVGESLTPGVVPMLEHLGVLNEMQSSSIMVPAVTRVAWGHTNRLPDENAHMGASGFVADRGQFDHVLISTAKAAGVRILQPAKAGPPQRTSAGWRVTVTQQDNQHIIEAPFLVDASGKRGVLPGHFERDSASTLSIFAYWTDTGIPVGSTTVEAGRNEWFWAASLPDGTVNAAVFLDSARCRGVDGQTGGRIAIPMLYTSLLESSTLLQPCLSGRLATEIQVRDASRRYSTSPVGDDYIRAGEASYSIDPLSSQGVQSALSSGLQAATVIHTILEHPENAELARNFYKTRQQEAVRRDRDTSSAFYRDMASLHPEHFWSVRAQPGVPTGRRSQPPLPQRDTDVRLAPDTEFIQEPVIRNDIVCAATAVHHPSLDRPVAWLEGTSAAALLEPLRNPMEAGMLIDLWSVQETHMQAGRTFEWFWSRGLIVAVGERA